jgi:predicted RNA binding protein with dsRBD fold (UPF0201 family)
VNVTDIQMLEEQEETRTSLEKLLRNMNRETSDSIRNVLEKEIDNLQSDFNVSLNYIRYSQYSSAVEQTAQMELDTGMCLYFKLWQLNVL